LCGLLTLLVGYSATRPYMESVAADAATVRAGTTYLFCFMPGLALQFALTAMGSALRGTGVVRPTMVVQTFTVLINVILAPILIAGWGTGHPLGVAGAGLASSIAVAAGVIVLWVYFRRLERYMAFNREYWRPQFKHWKRVLAIGLPAGGELGLIFIYTAIVYYTIRNFGVAAQAGFGIGSRVLQAIMLPAMAVAFAAGPIAGQNFGARNSAGVRHTFRMAALIGCCVTVVITVLAKWRPEMLIGVFTRDNQALAVGTLFLQLVSWNFIAQGFIFTCSSMFQGLGNTRPALWSSGTRLITFAVPAIWLSTRPAFRIEDVWYLSIATVVLQAALSLWLLRQEFRQRLTPAVP